MKKIIAILLLASSTLSSCHPSEPVATPTVTPFQKTPTRMPSLTHTLHSTSTPTHLPTLSGSGGGVIAYGFGSASGQYQIRVINVDGSEDRKLIDFRIGLNHADWSPDGQKIAVVGYMDSYVYNLFNPCI